MIDKNTGLSGARQSFFKMDRESMFYDVMVWTELFMALTVESLVYLFPCVVLFLPMHPFPLKVFHFSSGGF